MMLCLITVGIFPTQSNGDTIQRLNYGVIFREDLSLYIAKESWLHTFHIDLPTTVEFPQVSLCTKDSHIQDCQHVNSMVTFIHHLHASMETDLLDTISSIHTLVPQTKIFDASRSERSLLPFIGSLAKGLFGTATMGDVNLLASHINALNRKTRLMTQALQRHSSHLSSYITLANNRTSNLMQGIKDNTKEINLLTSSFQTSLTSLQQSMFNISQVLITMTNQCNRLRSSLDKMQAAVQSLVEGRISPFLLPRHTLAQTLHKVQGILTHSHKGFYLTHFHPSFYYTTSQFMFTRNHSSLYITLRLPLSTHAHPLKLYNIISLPVPTNTSSMHATEIINLPEFMAITHQHDYYVTLSSKQLTRCQRNSIIYCDFNMALVPTTNINCALALFNNIVSLVTKHCSFQLHNNKPEQQIIEITPTSALVYQVKELSLNCPEKQRLVPGCTFCLVNIPCECSLSTPSLYFAPRLVHCYHHTSEFSVFHPVNLALLQEFFDDNTLNNILADTVFETPIQLQIPDFKFYNHNMSKILAIDHTQQMSLRRVATAAKQDQVIFKSLTEPLLSGDLKLEQQWPDLNAILIFISLGIGTLSFIASFYLFCKTKKLATAIQITQQIAQVKSQSVPTFIFHKNTQTTTTSPNIVEKLLASEFTWLHASVILSIITLIFLLFVVCHLYRSKQKKGTSVILEITSGADCVTIPLSTLSLCPSYYKFSHPIIQDLTLSAFPTFKLFAIWSSFEVKDKLTQKSIKIPTTISISIFTWHKLKKIMQQPICAYILVTHHGYASVLNAPVKETPDMPRTLYPQIHDVSFIP